MDQIKDNGNKVLEACSFQDITSQRVNEVVKSITCVEQRVDGLVEMWGKDQLAKIKVPVDQDKTADQHLMSGPQLEGKGLSQDDIDSLFD